MDSNPFIIMAGSTCSLRSVRAQPKTAFSGVRSSCESVARNSSLIRFACSASSRAARSFSSRRARSAARRRDSASLSRSPISRARRRLAAASNARATSEISAIGVVNAGGGCSPRSRAAADCASAATGCEIRRPNTSASATASAAISVAPAVIATVDPRSWRSTSCTGTPVAIVQPEMVERLCAV